MKSFVYAFGKPIARVDGTTDDEDAGRYYFSTDHLGSVRNVTNEAGDVVWQGEFSAFGVLLFEEIVDESYEVDIVFAGHEWDEDVGMYYAKARWYDASLGRFISEDPVKDGLATMMAKGMTYDAAHAAALQKFNVSPFSVYYSDIIQSMPDFLIKTG